MIKVKKERSYWVILVFACFWALFTLYPFIVAVFSSLKDNDGIFSNMLAAPTSPVWGNYANALFSARIDRSIFNSLIVSSMSTVGILLFSSMVSFVLSRTDFKLNKAVFMLFLMGIVLPVYATLIPLVKMITKIPFMKSNSFFTLALIYIAINLPTSIFIITGFMRGISKELDEAATIDGCSVPALFFHILLPITMPAIATAGILAFLRCYNEMTFALVFLSERAKYTISLGMLYFSGDKSVEMGPLFAAIVLATIPMVVVYMLFQEQIQSGMVAGAVKG